MRHSSYGVRKLETPVGADIKRGYSESELENIYELGRFFAENGDIRRAEVVFNGVLAVAPDFAMARLGKAYIQIQSGEFDDALVTVRHALKAQPDSLATLLYLVACLLTVGGL